MENHHAHDYRHLVTRWRRIARACGLKLEPFAESGGFPLFVLRTRDHVPGGVYLSAGIHGDEPAGCLGLATWAEKGLPALARSPAPMPVMVFPCLNPWGLVNNRRSDQDGNDLNRLFNRSDLSPLAEWKPLLQGRRFDLAINLHEDFDAEGSYVYELHRELPVWGHDLLAACHGTLPADLRRRIDGRNFHQGLYRQQGRLRNIPGHPEAVYLYRHHCPRALTFETPSEFDLKIRVQAQVLLIEECVRRLLATARPPD